MDDKSREFASNAPYILLFGMFLFISFLNLNSQLPMLIDAGDSGPAIGIAAILAFVTLLFCVLGIYQMCLRNEAYKKMAVISMILFLVQLGFIFLEYTIFAIMAVS